MIEVKGTIVGNLGNAIKTSEIDAKETVVGNLGNTKQSLNGSTNMSGTYMKEYKLPIASAEELGGIKIGDNLIIEEDGRLSATGVTSYNDLTDKPTIPSKVSELENDSGYLTEIPTEYVTEEELADKGFLTEVPDEYITEEELDAKGYLTSVPDEYKTKEENDALYQPIGDYANKEDIPTVPTKVSELENDSGFISSVPSEYVTEIELDAKGYLTEHQNISHLATKEELHNHSNKEVLDSISQENVDKWNAGSRNVVLSASEPTMGEEIWFQKSVNLFNKETVESVGYIQEDGTIYKRGNYYITDYIKVTSGQQYTYSGFVITIRRDVYHAYYDENKNLLSTFARTPALSGTLTIPEGVSYVKFSLYYYGGNSEDEKDTFQFEKGSTVSAYQPYVEDEKIYTKTNAGYEEFIAGGGVVEESDPTVPAHVKAITQLDIAKWNSGTGGGTGGGEADTGWIDATLTDDFKLYNDASMCRYRRKGNTVSIQFVLSPTSSSNKLNSATETTVFRLPEGFRPPINLNTLCQGSGTNIFTVGIYAGGTVYISRYRNSSSYSSSPPSNTAWLPFHIMYFTD